MSGKPRRNFLFSRLGVFICIRLFAYMWGKKSVENEHFQGQWMNRLKCMINNCSTENTHCIRWAIISVISLENRIPNCCCCFFLLCSALFSKMSKTTFGTRTTHSTDRATLYSAYLFYKLITFFRWNPNI